MSVDVQREAVQAQIDRLRRSNPARISPLVIQRRIEERVRNADLASTKLDWF
jgi:hypothetical protein